MVNIEGSAGVAGETAYNSKKEKREYMNLEQFKNWALSAGSVGKYDDGQYVGECFPAGHFVTMADGTYKDIKDIRVGDEVFDALGEKELVVEDAISIKKKIWRVETALAVLDTTNEHPFLTKDGYKAACELTHEDDVFMPIIEPKEETGLTDDELKWLGFWLGDGSLIKRPKDWGYRLTVSGDKKHSYVDKLKVGVYQSKHSTSGITDEYRLHRTSHPLLSNILRQCYDDESFKQLPNIFTKRELEHVLDGYIHADGYTSRNGVEVSSISKKLLLGIQVASYMVGWSTGRITNHTRSTSPVINGKQVLSVSECWRLMIVKSRKRKLRLREVTEGGVWAKVIGTTETDETKEVYNIQTSDEHTFICDNIAVHNCVSLINQYCWRVLGVPAGAWGNAKDWATNANAKKYFTVVPSSQRGDILVYGVNAGTIYGHIEIALDGSTALFQNRSGNRRVGTDKELNLICLAILRPKNQAPINANTSGGSDVETIKSMYQRLLGREADKSGIETYQKAAQTKGWEFVYNDLKNSKEGQDDWAWRNPEKVRSLEKSVNDLKAQLAKKPTEVIVEKPVEVIKEVVKTVEVVKEVPVEKIVEVVKSDDERSLGDLLLAAFNKLFKIK